jgi:hypothetical protein
MGTERKARGRREKRKWQQAGKGNSANSGGAKASAGRLAGGGETPKKSGAGEKKMTGGELWYGEQSQTNRREAEREDEDNGHDRAEPEIGRRAG